MEEWKFINVPVYGAYYQISTWGRIRSVNRTIVRNGQDHAYRGRDLAPYMNYKGYSHIEFSIEGMRKSFPVHRLMGFTFLENPHNKPQIDHIDRDPTNNRLDNLRWATGCENQANRGIPKNNTSGELHISIMYKVSVTRQRKIIQKSFHTMEEAKAYRLEILGI